MMRVFRLILSAAVLLLLFATSIHADLSLTHISSGRVAGTFSLEDEEALGKTFNFDSLAGQALYIHDYNKAPLLKVELTPLGRQVEILGIPVPSNASAEVRRENLHKEFVKFIGGGSTAIICNRFITVACQYFCTHSLSSLYWLSSSGEKKFCTSKRLSLPWQIKVSGKRRRETSLFFFFKKKTKLATDQTYFFVIWRHSGSGHPWRIAILFGCHEPWHCPATVYKQGHPARELDSSHWGLVIQWQGQAMWGIPQQRPKLSGHVWKGMHLLEICKSPLFLSLFYIYIYCESHCFIHSNIRCVVIAAGIWAAMAMTSAVQISLPLAVSFLLASGVRSSTLVKLPPPPLRHVCSVHQR